MSLIVLFQSLLGGGGGGGSTLSTHPPHGRKRTTAAAPQFAAVLETPDIVSRLKSLLPRSWFTDETAVLDTVINGLAAPLLWIYQLYAYTLNQMRIATASGVWLDRICYDFLANRIARKVVLDSSSNVVTIEKDDDFRWRILQEILRPRQTRAAIIKVLEDLTDRTPDVLEFFNPYDCTGWGTDVFAYDEAGCWGDLSSQNQVFVTAYRPAGEGVPNVGGWGTDVGGYDVGGSIEYIDSAWVTAPVTDSDIYAAVAQTVAAGQTAWTAILS